MAHEPPLDVPRGAARWHGQDRPQFQVRRVHRQLDVGGRGAGAPGRGDGGHAPPRKQDPGAPGQAKPDDPRVRLRRRDQHVREGAHVHASEGRNQAGEERRSGPRLPGCAARRGYQPDRSGRHGHAGCGRAARARGEAWRAPAARAASQPEAVGRGEHDGPGAGRRQGDPEEGGRRSRQSHQVDRVVAGGRAG